MTNPVRKKKEEAQRHGVASMLVDRDYESLVALANLARRKHVETGELSQLVAWSDALALLGAHHVDPLPEPALRTWLDEQLLALDHVRGQLSEKTTLPARFTTRYQQLLPLLQEARERTPATDIEAVKERLDAVAALARARGTSRASRDAKGAPARPLDDAGTAASRMQTRLVGSHGQ